MSSAKSILLHTLTGTMRYGVVAAALKAIARDDGSFDRDAMREDWNNVPLVVRFTLDTVTDDTAAREVARLESNPCFPFLI